MIYKYSKKQFVYTLLKHKKTESKIIRISPEVLELINMMKDTNITAFIRNAIAEKLYRDGLRMIDMDNKKQFRKEASKPYVKGRCKNCWFANNW